MLGHQCRQIHHGKGHDLAGLGKSLRACVQRMQADKESGRRRMRLSDEEELEMAPASGLSCFQQGRRSHPLRMFSEVSLREVVYSPRSMFSLD
jgi:hypothetical protein